jgi:hypothetical protein
MAMGRARAVPWAEPVKCAWATRALCIWAERGFGPVAADLNFLFSKYIQFLANSKFCVGFI